MVSAGGKAAGRVLSCHRLSAVIEFPGPGGGAVMAAPAAQAFILLGACFLFIMGVLPVSGLHGLRVQEGLGNSSARQGARREPGAGRHLPHQAQISARRREP